MKYDVYDVTSQRHSSAASFEHKTDENSSTLHSSDGSTSVAYQPVPGACVGSFNVCGVSTKTWAESSRVFYNLACLDINASNSKVVCNVPIRFSDGICNFSYYWFTYTLTHAAHLAKKHNLSIMAGGSSRQFKLSDSILLRFREFWCAQAIRWPETIHIVRVSLIDLLTTSSPLELWRS